MNSSDSRATTSPACPQQGLNLPQVELAIRALPTWKYCEHSDSYFLDEFVAGERTIILTLYCRVITVWLSYQFVTGMETTKAFYTKVFQSQETYEAIDLMRGIATGEIQVVSQN
jgi:hypothetical protein